MTKTLRSWLQRRRWGHQRRLGAASLTLLMAAAGAIGLAHLLSAPQLPSAEVAAQGGTATPPPVVLPGAARTCRVVGRLDEVAASTGELWGSLQNVGMTESRLGALELGWSGNATLTQVVVRDPASGERSLFEGVLTSPAFVPLTGAVNLAPEQVVQLGLRFRTDQGAEPWLPGEVVVHFEEGCRTSLVPIRSSACELHVVDGPRPAVGRVEAIEVVLRADASSKPIRTLGHLEATWPAGTNGALVAITIDGSDELVLESPIIKSPATVPLMRLIDGGIPFVEGQRLTVGLVFERRAAEGPYALTFSTGDGCAVSASTRIAPPDCGLDASAFEVDDGAARVRLNNTSAYSRALESLALYWPAAVNGAVVEVKAEGRTVWRGEARRAPAELILQPPVMLPAQGGVELSMRFAASAGAVGAAEGGIARGAYTVIARLAGGCHAVVSARQTIAGCSLSAGEPATVSGQRALKLDVTSSSSDARLSHLALQWNPANGALTTLRFDGNELISTAIPHSSRAFTLTLEDGAGPFVARNARSSLWLGFEKSPTVAGTQIQMSFDGPDGRLCQDLLVTSPLTHRPSDCPYALTGIRQNGLDVLASLTMADGAPSGSLVGLAVDWPTDAHLRPLQRIDLLVPGGQERLLWQGPALAPPVVIDVSDGRIEAGTLYTLRLRFAGLPGMTEDPARFFRLTLTFADGCRAVNRTMDEPAPTHLLIEGVLQAPLPMPLLSCCWRVARSIGSEGLGEVVRVDTDAHTRIQPDAVTPRVGDLVSIDAVAEANGRYYAERVRFIRYRRVERLVGTIQLVAPDSGQNTGLPAWIEVLGKRVHIVERTVVSGAPIRGSLAIIEGERNPDGSLTAHEVRVARERASREYIEISGVVQRARKPSGVTEPGLLGLWSVGRYDIRVSEGTLISGNLVIPGQEPVLPPPGTPVRVYGPTVPDSAAAGRITIAAERIEVLELPPVRSLRGTIVTLPDSGLIGEWSMRSDQDEMVLFTVASMVVVDQRLAPAMVGAELAVRLQADGRGGWRAIDVIVDWGD